MCCTCIYHSNSGNAALNARRTTGAWDFTTKSAVGDLLVNCAGKCGWQWAAASVWRWCVVMELTSLLDKIA